MLVSKVTERAVGWALTGADGGGDVSKPEAWQNEKGTKRKRDKRMTGVDKCAELFGKRRCKVEWGLVH